MEWNEQESQDFIDFGEYFVPERAFQIKTICDLISSPEKDFHILELCCGEGLLAGALLEKFPNCVVHGYDGSEAMLQKAASNLAKYSNRFQTKMFDLAETDWRKPDFSVQAVVSSLAIHHLDGKQKQQLFRDISNMLNLGGVFVIADVIQPATKSGVKIAAEAWDNSARHRSLEKGGNLKAFEYFQKEQWNLYRHPDPIDKPSTLLDQLKWLENAGFMNVDVFWMKAGHVIFGGFAS